MSDYPVRHMKDGTATTHKTHDVVSVECDNPYHVACFEPIMSWAGDPIPRHDNRWHIFLDRAGAMEVSGPLVARESSQFVTGLKQRARHLHESDSKND